MKRKKFWKNFNLFEKFENNCYYYFLRGKMMSLKKYGLLDVAKKQKKNIQTSRTTWVAKINKSFEQKLSFCRQNLSVEKSTLLLLREYCFSKKKKKNESGINKKPLTHSRPK